MTLHAEGSSDNYELDFDPFILRLVKTKDSLAVKIDDNVELDERMVENALPHDVDYSDCAHIEF